MGKKRKTYRRGIRGHEWERHVDAESRSASRPRGHEAGQEPEHEPYAGNPGLMPNATVVTPYGRLAYVELDGVEHLCHVDGKLVRGKGSVLAPGDRVRVEEDAGGRVVRDMAPRRSKLSRPAVGHDAEKVFAANVDVLLVIAAAAKPRFKIGLVDRFLIAAEVGGVQPVLCVNKMDLVEEPPAAVAAYRDVVPVFELSCETGEGIEPVRAHIEGKTAVAAGHSGVGKSSLINRLCPGLDIATQAVSRENEKGRHTTSYARLYRLDADTAIIDTPGIRQIGLWGVSHAELDFYFPELERLAPQCKFRDCTHLHEPGCAVQAAVESGAIPLQRFQSYVRIREHLEERAEDRH